MIEHQKIIWITLIANINNIASETMLHILIALLT